MPEKGAITYLDYDDSLMRSALEGEWTIREYGPITFLVSTYGVF